MRPPRDLFQKSDKKVITLARKGSEEACGELVRRYAGPVFERVYRIIKHYERAEDLTQETFVKVFGSLDRFDTKREFEPWILTIARNTALNYAMLKRMDSFDNPLLDTPSRIETIAIDGVMASDIATPEPEPLRNAALTWAMSQLRPEHRRCIELRYLDDLSYEEIAEIMNVAVGTIGTYLYRGQQRLRQMLEPNPDSSSPRPTHTLP